MEAISLISDGLAAVMEGCRLPVKMKNPATGAEEWPKAEVIAIKASDTALTQYYVHYVDYNKRLDEWVTEERLVFYILVNQHKWSTFWHSLKELKQFWLIWHMVDP